MSSANFLWQGGGRDREGPLDRDTTAWVISLLFHLLVLVFVALIVVPRTVNQTDLTIVIPLDDKNELVEETKDFHYDTSFRPEVGAGHLAEESARWSEAPTLADESVVPNPEMLLESDVGTVVPHEAIEDATGDQFNEQLTVRGTAGVGTTGTLGAIDRIAHEILLMLQQRKVLVIWLFDQSGSLQQQRDQIINRFDRVYEELGVITSSNQPLIKRYKDKPLLTSIVAFGKEVTLRTKKPTDDVDELREAITGIELDRSGIELVFTAIQISADKYKSFRRIDQKTGEPLRNVLMIVVSDEVGDDQNLLEPAIQVCRRAAIPVHVIGVPAPFGRQETLVKWVDPDPNFDQSPQWGRVTQGPESFLVERIKLHFSRSSEGEIPIDSGFGPYALTRLCYDTGGIYFAVHPNRNTGRRVSGVETAVSSAHFSHFFNDRNMRKYRPDYVSPKEYNRRLASNQARTALVQSAQMSWIQPLEKPRLRFPKRSEAELANQLTQAQKQAARLEPKLQSLYDTLKRGERDRERETIPRWKAGYDLAMGRVLAVKVRTEAYNAMLAKAKRGMKFKNPQNDTWILHPSDDISVGSQLKKLSDKAQVYLRRVVEDHSGTPWALLAQRELQGPMGWEWRERFAGVAAPRDSNSGSPAQRPPPRDDRPRMIERPKPRRSPPSL